MRFHPSLLKEKVETDKNSKQQDDGSFEWRHYCLDPLFTTYNAQTMENMVKMSSSSHNLQTQLSTPRSNPLNLTGALGSSVSRIFSSLHEALPYYGTNSKRDSRFEWTLTTWVLNKTSDLCFKGNSQLSYQFQQQQSLPTDPIGKYPFSVNLTEQFMRDGVSNTCSVDNTTVVNDQLSSLNIMSSGDRTSLGSLKKKSVSDPNLFASLSIQSSMSRVTPLGNDQLRHQVRSEMRDRNIIDQNMTSTTTTTATVTIASTPLTMSTFIFPTSLTYLPERCRSDCEWFSQQFD